MLQNSSEIAANARCNTRSDQRDHANQEESCLVVGCVPVAYRRPDLWRSVARGFPAAGPVLMLDGVLAKEFSSDREFRMTQNYSRCFRPVQIPESGPAAQRSRCMFNGWPTLRPHEFIL